MVESGDLVISRVVTGAEDPVVKSEPACVVLRRLLAEAFRRSSNRLQLQIALFQNDLT